MKISASEIKPGSIIEYKNDLWRCLKSQAVKPGKGGAFNQVELKSISNKKSKISTIKVQILFKKNNDRAY